MITSAQLRLKMAECEDSVPPLLAILERAVKRAEIARDDLKRCAERDKEDAHDTLRSLLQEDWPELFPQAARNTARYLAEYEMALKNVHELLDACESDSRCKEILVQPSRRGQRDPNSA